MAASTKSRAPKKTAPKTGARGKATPAPQARKAESTAATKKSAAPDKVAKNGVKAAAATRKPTPTAKAEKRQSAAATGADVGVRAPAFELSDENGKVVSSSALAGKPYLLYFYPKDDTPGCTKEACDIRDNFARFGQQGLRVLGVSPDSSASHAKFSKKYGLPFTLLSDPEKTLANAYGVWGKKQNYGREYMGIIRSSFLIGKDGVIKKAYRGVKVAGHAAEVLADAASLL